MMNRQQMIDLTAAHVSSKHRDLCRRASRYPTKMNTTMLRKIFVRKFREIANSNDRSVMRALAKLWRNSSER